MSSVRLANETFAAFLWLCVTSAVLLGPYTNLPLLARAEWTGRSAFDLALARVILVLLYAQDLATTAPIRWRVGPAGTYTVLSGLKLPDALKQWDRDWMSRAWFEPPAMKALVVLALLGVCARPALLGLAVLEMRAQLFQRSHRPGRHHSGHLLPQVMLLFALAPCDDALSLTRQLSRSTRLGHRGVSTNAAVPDRRPSTHYTLPFVCLLLLLASAYSSAGLAKLVNCYGGKHAEGGWSWWAPTSIFWTSDHLKRLIQGSLSQKCSGEGCYHPDSVAWRPLCTETAALLAEWVWQRRAWVRPPAIHASCVLGGQYLLPAARFDLLPPIVLKLAAFGAVAWEVGMWLAVLAPGHRPRALAVCLGFLFHQSNIWMMRIYFHDFQVPP